MKQNLIIIFYFFCNLLNAEETLCIHNIIEILDLDNNKKILCKYIKEYTKDDIPSLLYSADLALEKKDNKSYFLLLTTAANLGSNTAQFNLGVDYFYGNNNAWRDKRTGYAYLLLSAINNNPYAMHKIALIRFTGDGVEKDYEQAIYWFEKSANTFYEDANKSQIILGDIYLNGLGVIKNLKSAFDYYSLAAFSGNPEALFKMAIMILENKCEKYKSSESLIFMYLAGRLGNKKAIDYINFNKGKKVFSFEILETLNIWTNQCILNGIEECINQYNDIRNIKTNPQPTKL